MSKNFRGQLAAYAKNFPHDDFIVLPERYNDGLRTTEFAVYSASRTGRALERYKRDRDAWRALRNLGYVREGKKWRKAPAADLPVPNPHLLHPIDSEVHS